MPHFVFSLIVAVCFNLLVESTPGEYNSTIRAVHSPTNISIGHRQHLENEKMTYAQEIATKTAIIFAIIFILILMVFIIVKYKLHRFYVLAMFLGFVPEPPSILPGPGKK